MIKKISLLAFLFTISLLINSCGDKEEDKITYTTDIKPILITKCAPCHLANGGNPRLYDSYTTSKEDVDKILTRIQKDKTDPMFMPLGGEKLSQAQIDLIKQWKTDGLLN